MWSEEDFWEKGRAYVRRAQRVEGEEGLSAFWMALAMEFIARAALSKVSPVLNADPGQLDNLLFALGEKEVGRPKTTPLHSVFGRCVEVVEGFEQPHREYCDFLGSQRNEELHTGTFSFVNLRRQVWLVKYYEVMDILCRHMDHELDDLFGRSEANAARELLATEAEGMESKVKGDIAAYRKVFEAKSDDERQQLIEEGRSLVSFAEIGAGLAERTKCPACSSVGLVTGREVRTSKPYYDGGLFVEQVRGLAQAFRCYVCGLELPSVSHVRWSGIDPDFTVVQETSLHEHQEMEYYGEYMNE